MATPEDLDDQLEQKKWLVNRFEAYMENMLKELSNVRELFKVRVSRIEVELQQLRDKILAAVAFIATALLGISSAAFYDQLGVNYQLIVLILLVDILLGLIVFIVFFLLIRSLNSIIQSGDMAFVSAMDRLNFLNGGFTTLTEEIQELEIERLQFFLHYQKFAGVAVRVEQIDAYDILLSSFVLKNKVTSFMFTYTLKSELKGAINLGTELMKSGIELFMLYEEEFNRYEIDFLTLNYIHRSFLESFKITFPTSQVTNSGAPIQ
jgi:hypothetical protein